MLRRQAGIGVENTLIAKFAAAAGKLVHGLPVVTRLLSVNVVVAAATFSTGVILARALGPAARGELANLLLWPMFLSHLGLCGVHIQLSREIAREPEAAARIYELGYRAVTAASLAAIAVYAAIISVAGDQIASGSQLILLIAAAAVIPFSTWNSLQVQMELGRGALGAYSLARASFAIVHLALIAGLWLLHSRAVGDFLAAFILAAILAAACTHYAIDRTLRAKSRPADATAQAPNAVPREALVKVVVAAWPYAVSTCIIAIATSADRIAVATAFDASTMGLYVVALALSQVQAVVNDAISPLFFARVARGTNIGDADRSWLAMRLRQSVLINASISTALMLAAPLLVPLIYGNDFSGSQSIIHLLVPAMSIRGMMQPFQEALKGGNRPLSQSFAAVVMTAVFAAGAAVAIMAHSIQGVALALLVSAMVGLAIVARTVARECGMPCREMLVPRAADCRLLLAEIRRMARL